MPAATLPPPIDAPGGATRLEHSRRDARLSDRERPSRRPVRPQSVAALLRVLCGGQQIARRLHLLQRRAVGEHRAEGVRQDDLLRQATATATVEMHAVTGRAAMLLDGLRGRAAGAGCGHGLRARASYYCHSTSYLRVDSRASRAVATSLYGTPWLPPQPARRGKNCASGSSRSSGRGSGPSSTPSASNSDFVVPGPGADEHTSPGAAAAAGGADGTESSPEMYAG